MAKPGIIIGFKIAFGKKDRGWRSLMRRLEAIRPILMSTDDLEPDIHNITDMVEALESIAMTIRRARASQTPKGG